MAEPVRVHLRVPGTAALADLMKLLREVEGAGFDGVGILDSQMLCRDTFVTLAQAAGQTSRLTLFPAVTNPFTRHASVLAGGIASVEELAPGRVKFIIGTGYTSASTIGRKPATLAEMRACIATVKALLAGQTVDFDGTPGRLGYVSGRGIPVIMAASGPKAIEVAGEIDDLAREQRLHGADARAHLGERGRLLSDRARRGVAGSDHELHAAGRQLFHRLDGAGQHGSVARDRVRDGGEQRHPRRPGRRLAEDHERVAGQHLAIENPGAVEARALD